MSERTSTKQKPMPSMLKSIQRSAMVASAAVDDFTADRQRTERQSLIGNDGLALDKGGIGAGGITPRDGVGPGGGGVGVGGVPVGGGGPKAPPGMKMSGRHQKMKNVMDNISRRLRMTSRGETFGFRGRDKLDATGKRYRVEVPKNMLVYVACVFFVLPLLLGLYVLLRQVLYGDEVHSRYGSQHDMHRDPLHGHDHQGTGISHHGGNATAAGHDLGLKAEEGLGRQPEAEEQDEFVISPRGGEDDAAAAEEETGGERPGKQAEVSETKGGDSAQTESGEKKEGGDSVEKAENESEGKGAEVDEDKAASKERERANKVGGKAGKAKGAKTYDDEVQDEIAEDEKDNDGIRVAASGGVQDVEKEKTKAEETGENSAGGEEEKARTTVGDAEEKEDTAKRKLRRFVRRYYWR